MTLQIWEREEMLHLRYGTDEKDDTEEMGLTGRETLEISLRFF
jgi:hypothetical protein